MCVLRAPAIHRKLFYSLIVCLYKNIYKFQKEFHLMITLLSRFLTHAALFVLFCSVLNKNDRVDSVLLIGLMGRITRCVRYN